MATDTRRSPLGMAVLGLLIQGPLHPYAIQQLIKKWGKDQVVNVGQRASLYKTINRLREGGLVEVHDTERDDRYPERTSYQLTPRGRATLTRWLNEMLSIPRNEFPDFPAALSFAMLLHPDDLEAALRQRRTTLNATLTTLDAELASRLPDGRALPRIVLIESEYLRAITAAELAWAEGVLDDLHAERFTWDEAELRAMAANSTVN